MWVFIQVESNQTVWFLLFIYIFKMAPVKANTSAVKKSKFVIDCSGPANDKIFDAAAFVRIHPSFGIGARIDPMLSL